MIQRHLHKNWREKISRSSFIFRQPMIYSICFGFRSRPIIFSRKKFLVGKKNEIKEIKGVSVEDTRTCFLGRSW